MINETERQALLDQIQDRFGVKLLWFKQLRSPGSRGDVTTHAFFDPEDMVTDDLKRELRRWVESQGWQFSRQMMRVLPKDSERVEHVYLAPMIPVRLAIGYHVTRQASLSSIKREGLLPSKPDRQTTDGRWDCEGNLYVCQRLGTPADEGVPGSESAHWWRGHLATNNRFSDPDWVILSAEVGKVVGARVYTDIWSESGIIVDNVPRISPDLIRLVYPAER